VGEPGDPGAQESVVEDRVVVLLEVGHPHDRVDERQQRLHALTVGANDRIHVGQVEDRDRTESVRTVFSDL